jgi:hypothetical protein
MPAEANAKNEQLVGRGMSNILQAIWAGSIVIGVISSMLNYLTQAKLDMACNGLIRHDASYDIFCNLLLRYQTQRGVGLWHMVETIGIYDL